MAPAPGGVVRGSAPGDNSGTSARIGAGGEAIAGSGRTSDGRRIVGIAAARTEFQTSPISFPFFGPWGRYYPSYGSGFGYGLGFVSYDPWRYGATRWLWNRYGMWYDPFGYDPYGYYPYSPSGYSSSVRDYEPTRTGSIRLKANPREAKVYIDGALVGIVDDFDGLTDHLELDGGPHQLELRAEGYVTYAGVITVNVGKTMTERVNLKPVKK